MFKRMIDSAGYAIPPMCLSWMPGIFISLNFDVSMTQGVITSLICIVCVWAFLAYRYERKAPARAMAELERQEAARIENASREALRQQMRNNTQAREQAEHLDALKKTAMRRIVDFIRRPEGCRADLSRLNAGVQQCQTLEDFRQWENVVGELIYRTLDKPQPIAKPRPLPVRDIHQRQSSDGFYRSKPWRSLRYQALKKYGGACCVCGRTAAKHGIVIHVDHIKPRSKYPHLALRLDNLQTMCDECNLAKSNTDEIRWRQ